MVVSWTILSFLLLLCTLWKVHLSVEPFDLPVLPTQDWTSLPIVNPTIVGPTPNFSIPKNIWMTMKTVPTSRELMDFNMVELLDKNPDWQIHFVNDTELYHFMNVTFANTSLLWAFYRINPVLMAARTDIWRMAVLWRYGGVYLDADSAIHKPLSQTIYPDDQILLSTEKNPYVNHYIEYFPLSKVEPLPVFSKRVVVQWCMVAAPFHPILTRYLHNVVLAVKTQYMLKPVFLDEAAHGVARLLATTGPFMFSASVYGELAVNPNVSYRYVGGDYGGIGGKFKAFTTPDHSNHYTTHMKYGAHLILGHYERKSRFSLGETAQNESETMPALEPSSDQTTHHHGNRVRRIKRLRQR